MEKQDQMEQQDHDPQQQVARLADDALAEVFRHVEPRWLAASRCVCKAWQTVIDDRRLLRADLLPLSLSGIFIHLSGHRFPELFSRSSSSSSTGPAISGNFIDFLPSTLTPSSIPWVSDYTNDYTILDHCNGLLLLQDYVVNPATRCWAPLPPRPTDDEATGFVEEFIVFDPTVSLHYEVYRVPFVVRPTHDDRSEWPPPICIMRCFSSRTGRWEERSFVRQGEAAGIIADMDVNMERDYAAYWRGALYVHWQDVFVMRISLSDQKYDVIRAPPDMSGIRYLGRSEKGVYLASVSDQRLRVWTLHERDGEMRWILKHDNDLKPMLAGHAFDGQACGPWVLEDVNYSFFREKINGEPFHPSLPEVKNRNKIEEKFEWNSDDDDDGILDKVDTVKQLYDGDINILGCHPYKEIVFLSSTKEHQMLETGLAYHLGSSKLQVLGNVCPTRYRYFNSSLPNDIWLFETFPYTPCWIEEFPKTISSFEP